MKEQLSNENIEALVTYRYGRALDTLAEVPFLKQQGYYNTAINRLYYACYYAVVALLLKAGMNPGTHSGVKQMLGGGCTSWQPGVCRASSDVVFICFSSGDTVATMMISPIRAKRKSTN